MKVLIIDDESLVRRSLSRAFTFAKHAVFEAADGESGLTLWRNESPDVVLLDVLMPGLTGPQVLNKIGKNHSAKVILISAYTGEYNLQKAQDIGADIFISKPFDNIFEIVKIAESLKQ